MSRTSDQPHRQSFRDPAGVLFSGGERIVRFVRPDACSAAETFLTSEFCRSLVSREQLVSTRRLDRPPSELDALLEAWGTGRGDGLWLEHERIAMPSYSYEWSPRMLHAAAALTLTLATEGVAHGFGLKDATPDNILFRGPQPVFVDVLSFEQRDPHDPTWLAHAQFVRTFLLPLLVSRALDLPLADATKNFQSQYIQKHIAAARGNMTDAAARLGLHRSNLYRKMRQLEMPVDEAEGE